MSSPPFEDNKFASQTGLPVRDTNFEVPAASCDHGNPPTMIVGGPPTVRLGFKVLLLIVADGELAGLGPRLRLMLRRLGEDGGVII